MFILFFLHTLAFAYLPENIETYLQLHQLGNEQLKIFDEEQKSSTPASLDKSESYGNLLAIKLMKHEIIHGYENSIPILPTITTSLEEHVALLDFVESYEAHFPHSNISIPKLENSSFVSEKSKDTQTLSRESAYLDKQISRKILKRLEVQNRIQRLVQDWNLDSSHEKNDSTKPTKIEPSPGSNGNITGNQFPEGTWALTYDDGPHPTRTLEIVDALEKNSIKATFFWLARNATTNQAVVNQVVEKAKSGQFSLQNHSFTHANLAKLKDIDLDYEIIESNRQLANLYGKNPTFFRCPYGSGVNNAAIRNRIAQEKMIHAFWNVDSLDWQDKNPASIVERVKTQMKKEKKGIILFHDIHSQTVETTNLLFNSLENPNGLKDLRWVTLPEIVEELNQK